MLALAFLLLLCAAAAANDASVLDHPSIGLFRSSLSWSTSSSTLSFHVSHYLFLLIGCLCGLSEAGTYAVLVGCCLITLKPHSQDTEHGRRTERYGTSTGF
mmetsp:Transcript_7711/g.14542  ORF Transcript_7711/g.14542 Transcript_7711/m.14542 type:complete len:101 (-) Transcript_7711:1639-1941(-)